MKWIFILAMIGLVPALAGWIRQNRRELPKIAMLMGFLPFVLSQWHLVVAPISWGAWPGHVKGMEISLLDAIALAVLLSSPKSPHKLPFTYFFLFFIGTAVMATFQGIWMASFFYVWQLCRTFLVFAAVTRMCADDRTPAALISGMVLGLCMQVFYTLQESLGGAVQTGGSFGHQNLLGMMTHFAVFPSLALLLAGNKRWYFKAGPIGGVIVAILTASRGTIGFGAGGIAGLFLLSGIRRWTSRKGAILGVALAALVVAAPLAMSSLNRRFEAAPLGAYDERAAFERAAHMIIAEHPFGVGANQYVVVANTQGYSARAGVIWTFGSRNAPVHNVYLLYAAEMSRLGMLAFIALIGRLIYVALRCAWQNRKDERGDVILGLGIAMAVVAIHNIYEWVFVTYLVHYMFAMDAGLIAGLALKLGYWNPSQRGNVRRADSSAAGHRPRRVSGLTEPLPQRRASRIPE